MEIVDMFKNRFRERLLIKTGFFCFVLLIILFPDVHPAVQANPITFKGKGKATLGPVAVTEGKLIFHIKNKTTCSSCSFSVSFESDNNLDGAFGSKNDDWSRSIFEAGYEEIKSLDTSVEENVYGGKVRMSVGGVGMNNNDKWEISLTSKPKPMHTLEVSATDARYKGGASWEGIIDNADIVLTDSGGNKYKVKGFTTYGYAHYYFDRKFFANESYSLNITASGYSSQSRKITPQEWQAVGINTLHLSFYLDKAGCEEVTLKSISVTDKTFKNDLGKISLGRPFWIKAQASSGCKDKIDETTVVVYPEGRKVKATKVTLTETAPDSLEFHSPAEGIVVGK